LEEKVFHLLSVHKRLVALDVTGPHRVRPVGLEAGDPLGATALVPASALLAHETSLG
jgi:hypothetical protein